MRWGDLVVDSGRDWAWALALARGARLYRDLSYHHGPLPPYANAALFSWFGARLSVLTATGLALAAACAALLYALARRGLGPWGAFLASAAFLYSCAFSKLSSLGGYDFILPYSWAATYGLAAALASLECALRWRDGGGRRWAAAAAAGLAAVALCKLEILAALAATLALVWAQAPRERRRDAWFFAAAAAAAAASVYAFFAAFAGLGSLLGRNLLIPHNLWGASQLHDAGLLDPACGLARALGSAAKTAGALAVAWWSAAAGAWPLAAGVPMIGLLLGLEQFRFLPFALAALLVWRWRGRRVPEEFDAFAPVLLFGALMLGRIALNCGAHHYGFYLLAPALPAYAYLLLRAAPWALFGDSRPRERAACAGAMSLLLVAGISTHAWRSRGGFTSRTAEVAGPRGRLLADAGAVGPVQAEAVRALSSAPPGASVVAFPEGAGIGFLAGLRHPVALDTFLPRDVGTPEAEARAIAMLEAAKPDFALIVPRDTTEFGAGPFGKGYAPGLAEYLRAHYALERMVESSAAKEPVYRIAILKRYNPGAR